MSKKFIVLLAVLLLLAFGIPLKFYLDNTNAKPASRGTDSGEASGQLPGNTSGNQSGQTGQANQPGSAQPEKSGQTSQSGQTGSSQSGKYSLESTTFVNSSGVRMVKNTDDILVLVNKQRNLDANWVPKDLVIPNVKFNKSGDLPQNHMQKPAGEALEQLFGAAKKDGINLIATSGYRPYSMQKRLFNGYSAQYGEAAANKFSARPGQSEHQTGLAMDITSASAGYKLLDTFGDLPEGKWLKEHAAEYGFIIRYQKGKEAITGYQYEPWHVRYVGREAADYIMSHNITLEEYYNYLNGK